MIESTEEFTLVHLEDEYSKRNDQPSFHTFSEKYLRGQIFNFKEDDGLKEYKYDGNVLIYCIDGEVNISLSANNILLTKASLLLINPNVTFAVNSKCNSSIHVTWTPPFNEGQFANKT